MTSSRLTTRRMARMRFGSSWRKARPRRHGYSSCADLWTGGPDPWTGHHGTRRHSRQLGSPVS
eukprot:10688985-Alexandrium_andersonii.AAC.1